MSNWRSFGTAVPHRAIRESGRRGFATFGVAPLAVSARWWWPHPRRPEAGRRGGRSADRPPRASGTALTRDRVVVRPGAATFTAAADRSPDLTGHLADDHRADCCFPQGLPYRRSHH